MGIQNSINVTCFIFLYCRCVVKHETTMKLIGKEFMAAMTTICRACTVSSGPSSLFTSYVTQQY